MDIVLVDLATKNFLFWNLRNRKPPSAWSRTAPNIQSTGKHRWAYPCLCSSKPYSLLMQVHSSVTIMGCNTTMGNLRSTISSSCYFLCDVSVLTCGAAHLFVRVSGSRLIPNWLTGGVSSALCAYKLVINDWLPSKTACSVLCHIWQ